MVVALCRAEDFNDHVRNAYVQNDILIPTSLYPYLRCTGFTEQKDVIIIHNHTKVENYVFLLPGKDN